MPVKVGINCAVAWLLQNPAAYSAKGHSKFNGLQKANKIISTLPA
jgi:hypothetical protein